MKSRIAAVVLAFCILSSSVIIQQGYPQNLVTKKLQSAGGILYPIYGNMSRLHTEGRDIKDENGTTVQLKGVNTPHGCDSATWQEGSHQLDENDFAVMKLWGMNVVRFTFNGGSTSNGGWFDGTDTTAYDPSMDEWVNRAERKGLYIILDMHRWNGGGVGVFANDVNLWVNTWVTIATRYANRLHVLFELMNEPHGGAIGDGASQAGFNNWRTFAQQAYDAIRNAGVENIIVVGGWVWQNELASWNGNWLENENRTGYARNVVYSTHHYVTGWGHYPPSDYNELLNFFSGTGMEWDTVLQQNVAPLLVGEFNLHNGGSPTDPSVPYDGDERLTCFDNYMNIFDNGDLGALVSYTPWCWVSYPDWPWEFSLVGPHTNYDPARTGQILQNHLISS